ncbi:hypothetical protein MVES1_002737 [Malassezia vespertilionis]|uniref:uncharacterized protein n=1 Tax=Malassezia vespertilionis TaxID=2020962 RepID=UPI0024B1E75A|nr:uncharacterized protein MVES1_002737 [Malassezia vespertilionis]WFD07373.1 hypothetical protein MVES1_002737 [Malassezia vespertilionis]
MKFFSITAAALLFSPALGKFLSGVPWGTDNRWAYKLPKDSVSWYHHWEKGMIFQMPSSCEYVPTFWGPSKQGDWNMRKFEIATNNKIKSILAFNEPDVPSQASMTPEQAVALFMKELQPYAEKGYQVSSPQMVFNMDWLSRFMSQCHDAGCKISFMALHWYGAPTDMDKFTAWVDGVYQKFKLPIWITEYGLTSGSNPSDEQVMNFLRGTTEWIASKPYVQRAAWNGGYDISAPPDAFATPLNAFFVGNGDSYRSTANYWFNGLPNTGLITLPSERAALAHANASAKPQHGHGHGHGKRDGLAKRRLSQ